MVLLEGWGASSRSGRWAASHPWEHCGRSNHKDQAMAWISVVVASQERESSPEDHLAQRWVEVEDKETYELMNEESQGGKTRRWSGRIPETNWG